MRNKSRSRFLAFALVLVLLIGIVPVTALAADGTSFTYPVAVGLNYTVLSESGRTVAVTGGLSVGVTTILSSVSHTYWSGFKSTKVDYTVTTIAENAFSNKDLLTDINIPNTITHICTGAFSDCDKLSKVIFWGNTPPTIDSGAFSGIPSGTVFVVPAGCYSAYKDALPSGSIVREMNYAVLLSESSLDFGSEIADYTPVGSQTITITNIGILDVKLKTPTSPYFDISLSRTTIPVGGTATMTVTPKTGLDVGTYDETIDVEGTSLFVLNTSVSFDASFEVIAHTYTLSAYSDVDFGTYSVDYGTAPAEQTVTVENTGNTAVTLIQPTSTDFTIGTPSDTELDPGETATFTVQPVLGLDVGPHSETITVSNTNGESASVNASFEVVNGPALSADVAEMDFGSAVLDYAASPDGKTVTVTNTGAQEVTLTLPTSTDFTVDTADSLTLASGESATFTIQPKTGLVADTYEESIVFEGVGEYGGTASVTVDVTFEVLAHTYILSATPGTTLDFGSLTEAYTIAPTAQTVTVENTGNTAVTLTQPTSTDFIVGTLSDLTLDPGETATFTVQPKLGLAFKTYSETIDIDGSDGASTSVAVTFTVKEDYKLVTKLSDPTGVSVSGLMKTDVQLVVSPLGLGTDAGSGTIRAMQSDGSYTFIKGWNLSLTGDFKGSFTITLPVDAKYNGQTLTILHAASSGLKTYSAVVKDGKISFTVTEFSPFAVFAKVDKAPYTGDTSSSFLWFLLSGFSAAGLVATSTVLVKRKSRSK